MAGFRRPQTFRPVLLRRCIAVREQMSRGGGGSPQVQSRMAKWQVQANMFSESQKVSYTYFKQFGATSKKLSPGEGTETVSPHGAGYTSIFVFLSLVPNRRLHLSLFAPNQIRSGHLYRYVCLNPLLLPLDSNSSRFPRQHPAAAVVSCSGMFRLRLPPVGVVAPRDRPP